MKNLFIVPLATLAISCSSSRHTTNVEHPRTAAASSTPVFLENISINHPTVAPPMRSPTMPRGAEPVSADVEHCGPLQFKYAILLEEEVENMTNLRLISFLERWYGTPYKFGGGTATGIDCSAFAALMVDSVYSIHLPRTCREQYEAAKKISRSQLAEGDLVFFNTTGGISHVGVYLNNNKFVHASTSGGVMISDLDEAYFKRRYYGSARVR